MGALKGTRIAISILAPRKSPAEAKLLAAVSSIDPEIEPEVRDKKRKHREVERNQPTGGFVRSYGPPTPCPLQSPRPYSRPT